MRYDDNPDDVLARWSRRQSLSPFDREQLHAEVDAAERRYGRRARYRPLYHRRSEWIDRRGYDDRDGDGGGVRV